MRVLKQIIKEFWLPFLLSISWTLYISWSDGFNTSAGKAISSFGGSFFLISWMIGQIFRVSKQIKVEKNFDAMEKKFSETMLKIETMANDTIGNITGGDSYPFIITSALGDMILLTLTVKGKYPIRNIHVTFKDVTNEECSTQLTIEQEIIRALEAGSIIFAGELGNGSAVVIHKFRKPLDRGKYLIKISTLNGLYDQVVEINKIYGNWNLKSELFNSQGKKIDEHIL